MPINPNIALQGQTPQIGEGILKLAAIKQQKEDRAIQKKRLEKESELTDLQIKDARDKIRRANKEESLQDLYVDEQRILENADNPDRVVQIAKNRLERLNQRKQNDPTVTTTHTENFLKMYQNDPDEAIQFLRSDAERNRKILGIEEDQPLSSTGKLVRDYREGFIDKETLDQKLKPTQSTAEFERLLESSNLPEETKNQLKNDRLTRLATGEEGFIIETDPEGGVTIRQGKTPSLSPSEEKELRNAEVATKGFIASAGDMIDLLKETPDINTLTAKVASKINNFQQEVKALARNLGVEFEESVLDPGQYSDIFDSLGIQNERAQSLYTSMAFQAAAASGQTGRSVSDKDVARFLQQVGAGSSDPRAIAATLRDTANRTARDFRINYETRKKREYGGDLGLERLSTGQEQETPEKPVTEMSNEELLNF